jgi:ABC-type microcin C transport system permease subunit YejB
MPLITIAKSYLVSEDENSITLDLPESFLESLQRDYKKVAKAKGILKHKKEAILAHLDVIRG